MATPPRGPSRAEVPRFYTNIIRTQLERRPGGRERSASCLPASSSRAFTSSATPLSPRPRPPALGTALKALGHPPDQLARRIAASLRAGRLAARSCPVWRLTRQNSGVVPSACDRRATPSAGDAALPPDDLVDALKGDAQVSGELHLTDRQGTKELLEEDLARVRRKTVLGNHEELLGLVVVDQGDAIRPPVSPPEHEPPCAGDTDAVRSATVTPERLQPVAGGRSQVFEAVGGVEHVELAQGGAPRSGCRLRVLLVGRPWKRSSVASSPKDRITRALRRRSYTIARIPCNVRSTNTRMGSPRAAVNGPRSSRRRARRARARADRA